MIAARPPLVGRGPELAALGELVRTLRRGGRLAVLEGEAGIGKTRLVDATFELARGAGAAVLAARAEELEARRPFGPLVDAIGRERLGAHLDAWEVRPDAAAERQFGVAEAIEYLPAGLLVSARPQPRRPQLETLLGALAERGARTLRLGPLDPAASGELLAALVGVAPGARLARQAERAAGNPLFVCE